MSSVTVHCKGSSYHKSVENSPNVEKGAHLSTTPHEGQSTVTTRSSSDGWLSDRRQTTVAWRRTEEPRLVNSVQIRSWLSATLKCRCEDDCPLVGSTDDVTRKRECFLGPRARPKESTSRRPSQTTDVSTTTIGDVHCGEKDSYRSST